MTSEARFNELYDSAYDALGRYCLRRLPSEDAKEAHTETFLIAWRRVDQIPDGENGLYWLYGIARNVIRNRQRSTRRALRVVSRLSSERSSSSPDPAEQVIRHEQDREVLDALESLPPEDQEILRLRTYEELDFRQISLVLGCTIETARKRSSRAVKRLGARLGEPQAPPRVTEGGRAHG